MKLIRNKNTETERVVEKIKKNSALSGRQIEKIATKVYKEAGP